MELTTEEQHKLIQGIKEWICYDDFPDHKKPTEDELLKIGVRSLFGCLCVLGYRLDKLKLSIREVFGGWNGT